MAISISPTINQQIVTTDDNSIDSKLSARSSLCNINDSSSR
jgi:hypothetical protein